MIRIHSYYGILKGAYLMHTPMNNTCIRCIKRNLTKPQIKLYH